MFKQECQIHFRLALLFLMMVLPALKHQRYCDCMCHLKKKLLLHSTHVAVKSVTAMEREKDQHFCRGACLQDFGSSGGDEIRPA